MPLIRRSLALTLRPWSFSLSSASCFTTAPPNDTPASKPRFRVQFDAILNALAVARRRFDGRSSDIRDLAAGYTVGILPTSRWPVSLWLNRLNMRISIHDGNPR